MQSQPATPQKKGCAKGALLGCGGAIGVALVGMVLVLVLFGAGWKRLMHWLEGGDLPTPQAGWCAEAANCCLKSIGGRSANLTAEKRDSCDGIRELKDEQCQLTYNTHMQAARRWGHICSYTTKDGGRYHPE